MTTSDLKPGDRIVLPEFDNGKDIQRVIVTGTQPADDGLVMIRATAIKADRTDSYDDDGLREWESEPDETWSTWTPRDEESINLDENICGLCGNGRPLCSC